jgi:hypothetical protein
LTHDRAARRAVIEAHGDCRPTNAEIPSSGAAVVRPSTHKFASRWPCARRSRLSCRRCRLAARLTRRDVAVIDMSPMGMSPYRSPVEPSGSCWVAMDHCRPASVWSRSRQSKCRHVNGIAPQRFCTGAELVQIGEMSLSARTSVDTRRMIQPVFTVAALMRATFDHAQFTNRIVRRCRVERSRLQL